MTKRFRKLMEECLVGGTFLVGYESLDDDEFVPIHQAEKLFGRDIVILGGASLQAPSGATGICSDGTLYKKQVIDEEGKLHIVRPASVK